MRTRHTADSWIGVIALATIVAAYVVATAAAHAQVDQKAAAVMSDVRKALGGEQKLAGVRALSLRADYRREVGAGMPGGGGTMMIVRSGGAGSADGGGQQTGKLEIDLELPDKYLRSDIGSAAFGMTRTEGFEGGRPFVELVPNSPGMRVMTDSPTQDPARARAALKRSHVELARLMLGLTGSTQPGFPVTYAYGGEAESPDGKAHVIDVTGPEDFKVRLFIDTQTSLPLMLSFIEAEPRMVMRTMTRDGRPGQRGAQGGPVVVPGDGRGHQPGVASGTPPSLTPEQQAELDKARAEAEATPPKMIEFRLFFSDYEKVDGVALPRRIARGTGTRTTEEWDVTSYQVNPPLKADRFKVGSH
jgi:hypothetical protein